MAHELTSTPPARVTARERRRERVQLSLPRSGRLRTDAFERLFEEHAERLFAFLAYRTGDRVLAEDLLSETFERVLRSRARFDPRRGSERRWLYTIALNLLRDHARRRTHEQRLLQTVGAGESGGQLDPGLEALAHRDELQRALATLCEQEREALALRFGADLKLREVARILGEGESAVEGRIYRALRKLRAELE
ncbi:MAG TPA: sigma-70 family RNA polymerase sigma factor [Solirubrobacteraceae bacterium]|nr:sigma-70 family RNA polymerase sigma factor [Solirubrobacteraceae bacterium]